MSASLLAEAIEVAGAVADGDAMSKASVVVAASAIRELLFMSSRRNQCAGPFHLASISYSSSNSTESDKKYVKNKGIATSLPIFVQQRLLQAPRWHRSLHLT